MANFTDDDDVGPYNDFPSKVTFWIEGVGILVIGFVGLIINIVALWILFRKQVLTYLTLLANWFLFRSFLPHPNL